MPPCGSGSRACRRGRACARRRGTRSPRWRRRRTPLRPLTRARLSGDFLLALWRCRPGCFELLFLGAAGERRNGGVAAAHRLGDRIEVAGANFALVLDGAVAGGLGGELGLLQLDVGGHLLRLVAARQLEHRVVECVESGERDELEAITHRRELALELRDGGVVELSLPVEGGRAVVGEELA